MLYNKRFEYWKQIVDACDDSLISISEWCKENNINKSSYYKWKKIIYPVVDDTTFIKVDTIKTHGDVSFSINGITIKCSSDLVPAIVGSFK